MKGKKSMRCPYCGGLNQERAAFCVNCGRDLRRPLPNTQAHRPSSQSPQQASYPGNQAAQRGTSTPSQPQRPVTQTDQRVNITQPPVKPSTQTKQRQQATATRATLPPPVQAPPPEPEPSGPFPPRTMKQWEDLLATGCQAYTVAESHVENGQKKYVSIFYPRCASWQQAATLLKALRENQEERYSTIIIRGLFPQQQDSYGFTNGQLQFDRNVRLGALICNRYMVETGNGYSADSLRFVMNA